MLVFEGRRPLLLLAISSAFPLAAIAASFLLPPTALVSSSGFAFWCGVLAGLLILAEWFLWIAKRFRGNWLMRFLPRTSWWLWLHLWAGLTAIPLAIIHSGYRLGGPLTATTMVLFLAVSITGIWGMIIQQIIPRRLLQEVPMETVAALSNVVEADLLLEARRIMDRLSAATSTQRIKEQLADFLSQDLLPYLEAGPRSNSPLREPQGSAAAFSRLAAELPADTMDDLRELERCAEARRQLDHQLWLDGLLHGWLLAHVPLSVAFTVVLIWHVLVGLKLW